MKLPYSGLGFRVEGLGILNTCNLLRVRAQNHSKLICYIMSKVADPLHIQDSTMDTSLLLSPDFGGLGPLDPGYEYETFIPWQTVSIIPKPKIYWWLVGSKGRDCMGII